MVTGGLSNPNGTNRLKSVELYDSSNNSWSIKSSLQTARLYHQQVTYKDKDGKTKVMVIGGNVAESTATATTEIYDSSSDTWIAGPSMSFARGNMFSAILLNDGRILVTGNDAPNYDKSEVYDPKTNLWTTYQLPYTVDRLQSVVELGKDAGYKVLLAGGIDLATGTATNRALLFDPQTNTWTSTTSMNFPRYGLTLTLLNDGRALAVNGSSTVSSDLSGSSELYIPTQVLGDSTGPAPFLDLPWDYTNKLNDLNRKPYKFNESALAINSYFDHAYPLLGSGIAEPATASANTISFNNIDEVKGYSNHNGYDWGVDAHVSDGGPVLAAASGSASFVPESQSGGAGNVVNIDHGNGYQTWYEHLYPDGLASGAVKKGDKIGRVGHFGNCYVENNAGKRFYNTPACVHIHFGVFQDKNNDKNFDDNVPDGVTDPFGWEPKIESSKRDPDPWEIYSFLQNGVQKKGNKSNYLWTQKIDGVTEVLTTSGKSFDIGEDKVELLPDQILNNLTLSVESEPSAKLSDNRLVAK